MLDACAPHARWIDVFCERGAFDADQARDDPRRRDRRRACMPRIHANQLQHGAGRPAGGRARRGVSADHCTHLTDADVDALAGSGTVATLLPGAEFSTRSPYPDARRAARRRGHGGAGDRLQPGLVATPRRMPFCIALAVREMRMTPAEAVWSATAGGARALRRDDIGRLAVGARADLVILDAPSHLHLAYRPGVPTRRSSLVTAPHP